jgi:hypothetical protein
MSRKKPALLAEYRPPQRLCNKAQAQPDKTSVFGSEVHGLRLDQNQPTGNTFYVAEGFFHWVGFGNHCGTSGLLSQHNPPPSLQTPSPWPDPAHSGADSSGRR